MSIAAIVHFYCRVAGEEKFLVRETYPVELAKHQFTVLDRCPLLVLLSSSSPPPHPLLTPHRTQG